MMETGDPPHSRDLETIRARTVSNSEGPEFVRRQSLLSHGVPLGSRRFNTWRPPPFLRHSFVCILPLFYPHTHVSRIMKITAKPKRVAAPVSPML
jgi:hypothetical protein